MKPKLTAKERAALLIEQERLEELKIQNLKEAQEVDKIFGMHKDMTLLEKMRSGKHIKHVIEHDGIAFSLRMISLVEWQNANSEAIVETKKCTYIELQNALFEEWLMIKVLTKAADIMNDIDEDILLNMTHASIYSLYVKYVNECEKYSPPLDKLDQDIEVTINQLKKSKIHLKDLSRQVLETITITLLNKDKI
jgi:NOL1/NOP2/fmu family ribosome biogenesis protein